jgi:conjugative relaxase-like TrwC/TraI family protein
MLVMSKGALSAAQAETYYEEKWSHDDYYSEKQQVVGQWFGRGANELGLDATVTSEDFRCVLRGINPLSGESLVPKANGYSDRRAGWDATFNAPKSVSIQALVGGDEGLIQAHHRAVGRGLGELEQYALSRQHGGSQWVVTANIVAARFDHIAARPATGADDGYGPDPHLHTHVVIANMTRRPDGEWRGLDPVEIYRAQSFATAVYRAELAREVQRLGYGINLTGRDGRWELDAYTREQVTAFSRRRQDIEKTLAQQGLAGAEAAQNIAHRTRLGKDHRDQQALRAEWRSRAQVYGIETDRYLAQSRQRVGIELPYPPKIEEAVRQSLAENSDREAVIDRRALEAKALQHAMGKADLDAIRNETQSLERQRRLISLENSVRSPRGAYTTPEMIALERDNLELMRAGQGAACAIGATQEIRQWVTRRHLLSDQAAAAQVTLSSTDWLTAIEGRAGATKTTTVGAIREFAQEHGYAVHGFAPTTRAVKALSEAGVPARTIASLLESRSRNPQTKQVWIIDESSLLATRQVNRLLHQAQAEGVERVIFVGDQRQHHAIEAGRPISQMQTAGMAVARLETIRRQRDPELRQAVTYAAQGEIGAALAILERRGDLREVSEIEQRRGEIARRYAAAHNDGERVLVVSPANQERRELNQAIRAALIARGHVDQRGQPHTILANRSLSGPQRAVAYNYEPDDVIRFNRGSKQFDIAKGSYAKVETIDREQNTLGIRTAGGRAIRYNPGRLFGVEVFREEQRVVARGERIQFRAPEPALGIANGDFATVVAIDGRRAVLHLDHGKQLSAGLDRLRHIDHGYASTSHSAQGATVDRVIVDIDTRLSPELVNRKQFYVSISRARNTLMVFTNDRTRLARVVNRSREKSVALEYQPRIAPASYVIVSDEQRPSLNRSYGMRR